MKIALPVILLTSLLKFSSSHANCTKVPQLHIKITSVNGNVQLHQNVSEVSISEPSSVEIICVSSEPLEMDFKGEMATRFQDIQITRRPWTGHRSRERAYCVEGVLKIESKTSATGNYTCQTIANRSEQEIITSVYIFADTGDNGHLLNAGQSISTGSDVPDNFRLIIPCIVTKASSKPKLYRFDPFVQENSGKQEIEETRFPYDPMRGFIIDTRNTSDCWTDFVCVLGAQRLRIKTVQPKEFRAEPQKGTIVYSQSPVVNYNAYSKMAFTCESIHNNTFTHTIKDTIDKNIRISHMEQPEKYYKYKSKLRYFGNFEYVANTSTVSCVEAKNHGNVYRKWTIVHRGHKDKTGLFFDNQTKSFYCYSATAQPTTPNLTLISCDNSLECQIAQRFILEDKKTDATSFPFRISDVGYPCRNKPATIYSGCKEFPIQIVEQQRHYGMAHCQTGDYHYFSIYFKDLSGNTVTSFSYKNLKEITVEKINRTVYVNETVTFTCYASSLQFSSGILITANVCPGRNDSEACHIYENDFPQNATLSVKEDVEKGVITFTATITIWTNRITGFTCDVPVLTTHKWTKVYEEIFIADGEYPEIENIKNSSFSVKRYENVKNKTLLTCIAKGVPLPTISWERRTLSQTIQIPQNVTDIYGDTVVSTIDFQNISPVTAGDYFCIATNAKGSTRKMFSVVIASDDSHLFMYFTIAGTVVAAIFLLLLFILIGVLRRQKRAIEKLTEAEIKEFEHGNETMAHHSSELHEIAQYLPYNLDFEVSEKELELSTANIDEDLLGTGAFGLVLKGYVERNGEKYAVAIKTIKSSNNVSQLKKLLIELKIMMHIGRHVNIIYLIGAQTRKLREGQVRVIVEYCAFGNLQTFLRENRGDFVNQVVNDQIDEWIMPRYNFSRETKSMRQNRNAITKLAERPIVYQSKRFSEQSPAIRTLDLVNWCYQLANGMEYLAIKKVIHGDLATRNLLLTEDWTLKITDFGLSRHMYEYTNYIRKEKVEPLPWRWLSIEAIRDSKFSTMSDVWAFGVTAWEIFSLAEVPYPGFSWGEEFVRALSKGYRMSKPHYATTDLYNKILECWRHDLTDRPTFNALKEYFQQILETYSNSTEKILEAFLGPEPFDFECKSVQTTPRISTSSGRIYPNPLTP